MGRRRRRRARQAGTVALLAGLALAIAALVAPAPSASLPLCTEPVFTNGLSQAVFASGTANYINEQGWVEAPFDSDFDGNPDRIHFDVSRPLETGDPSCNLKVPVIFEDSPYYANLGPSRNWAVDHELGSPPASRAAEPYFTAANTNPTISTIYESTWLPRGFAVMHAESPGTGNSDGCPTSGAPNETLAAKAVIDWLNGRATAYTTRTGMTTMTADWTTGKVGMIGTSYNGTIPEGVATTGVDGLEAIVPISAISNWYDYYRANGAVRAPYTFQGEDLDVLEDAVYSRADEPAPQRLICQDYIRNVTQNGIDRASGDYNAFWDDRNYMKNVANVHAAALIAHGNMDLNVMTKNFDQFYRALRAQGVPHQLYFHRGGHGGAPPDSMINRWFTRYLYGVGNGVESEPRAWVVREANACPPRSATVAGDQSSTNTLTVADSSQITYGMQVNVQVTSSTLTVSNSTATVVAVPDATHVVFAAAVATAAGSKVANGSIIGNNVTTVPANSVTCGSNSPTPYAEWPDPGASAATVHFTSGGLTSGGLTFGPGSPVQETLTDAPTTTLLTLVNASSNPARLLYVSPVLTKAVRLSGTVHVSLRMAFSKARANLTAVLVDLPGSGPLSSNSTFQERSTRGWIDPENRGGDPAVSEAVVPGTFYTVGFDLQPKDLVAVAGRRLGVLIASSDQESTIRPAAGTQLTLDLAQSSVELPIIGGASELAQAFGLTAAARISIAPGATNEAGQPHTFTVTLTKDDGSGFAPAAGETVTIALTPAGGAAPVPSGPFTLTTDASGQATATFTSASPGTVAGHASASLTVNGVPLTVQTDGQNGNSGDAVKTFVDAIVVITPQQATNPAGSNHVLTGHVLVNTGSGGYVDAPDGTLIGFGASNSGGAAASFVGGNTCLTSGGGGSCNVTISSPSAGQTTITATTTVSVGGVSLLRTTGDAHVGDSPDATKLWADAGVSTSIRDALGNDVTNQTVLPGTVVHDEAIVSKTSGTPASVPSPTGTVDFTLYDNGTCDGAVLATDANKPLSGAGVATSASFTPAAGSFSYRAHYDGDANYPQRDGPCEPLTVESGPSRIACLLTAVIPGPPKAIQVTVQASGGLASIAVIDTTNATTTVQPFVPGTTGVVLVDSTKINQALKSRLALLVTATNGETKFCDPVVPGTKRR